MNAECSQRGYNCAAQKLVIMCQRCEKRKECMKHSKQAINEIMGGIKNG